MKAISEDREESDLPFAKLLTPRAGDPLKKTDVTVPAEDAKVATASFFDLYRYATPYDKLCVFLGVVAASTNGALYTLTALVFGKAIASFQQADGGVELDAINSAALLYLLIAIGLFATDYVAYVLFSYSAERQMKELRKAALRHILYMDIGWFDSHDALELSSRLTSDTVIIKDGMGNKLGEAFKCSSQFVAGFIIGLSRGWEMALVMSSVMPFMAFSLAYFITVLPIRQEASQKKLAEATAVAEETLGSIRTVASLNGERRAIGKFRDKALLAEAENLVSNKVAAGVFGFFMATLWLMYAAGLWYGGTRVAHDDATPRDVFQAYYGILLGSVAIAEIPPNVNAVFRAIGAASAILDVLATPSVIDHSSEDEGFIPDTCAGHIQAIDVHFAYPSRPNAPILNGYNVTIESGQTVAFVGASGGGKSTLIALLERFYNPQSGQILLDGRDISTLNLKWLRSQIGMVSQEPVLFARTIYENIAAGGQNISREQAIEAAKMANAHNFIMSLPQQYDTLVGEKGVSLSGGQKQRVAIARAVVRNPKILVLDEATSALDNESERVVQDALNELMDKTKMTTLVIAHRLSTIRRADKIVVLSGGRVVEEGKHEELLSIPDGVYNNLYTIQEERAKEEAEAAAVDLASVSAESSLMHRTLSCRSANSALGVDAAVDEREVATQMSIIDVMRMSRPEKTYFKLGLIGAAVCGFGLPSSSILISAMVNSMTTQYAKYLDTFDRSYLHALSDDVTLYGVCYIIGAAIMFTATALKSYCFGYVAEKLMSRLRDINFTALCRQNIAFFDEKDHATGALTAELSTNPIKVAQISGDTLGRSLQGFFTILFGLVVSFTTGSWLLTLIMLAASPALVFGLMYQMGLLQNLAGLGDELGEVGAHASEALANIRTVAALGMEKDLIIRFDSLLQLPLQQGKKEAQINGLAMGFSSFIVFAMYSLAFWSGGILVNKNQITFLEMMRTLMAIMLSTQGLSYMASFFGDSEKALKAGRAIVAVRDRPLPIDSFDEGGLRPDTVQGKIEFKNITFRYPTRPGVTVLRHYNLTIEPGQTVAFCGPSGGGKSTCISMIERFYDPVEGEVLLDGRNLKDLNVQWLRSQIGLVGQEPTLFIGTIAENIAYGLDFKPSHEEIVTAAKMANAHDFITQFPDGYETQVGLKGEQLSGGQKQRIAIARAILKNPNILLLDEATSALDSESEKIMQEALDKVVALKRRTTIIIAHRLSTIRKADKICVVSGGKIAEQGTHAELLALGGIDKKLVESSTL